MKPEAIPLAALLLAALLFGVMIAGLSRPDFCLDGQCCRGSHCVQGEWK